MSTESKDERRSFSTQFRICNGDGTCQHMSRANYFSMSDDQQKNYDGMGMPPNYFGPRGPLFCGAKPGICSSKHCPKR